ncbi:MAG TPA: tRNA (adenine-N1)-methyltransferase [Egibacteraceae bacterium]|nr:tRNA (adenine-N1)-methyltransferase [Actinomycetota bacterium]HWB73142.1 tRNA (adenine-N1)-methyltransferase [Egibacteraceae bacterium]
MTPRHPGHPDPFSPGDTVLLIDRKGRRYLTSLRAGGTFHYHGGAVAHDELLGQPEGSRVRSAKGASLLVVRPTAADWTLKAPRGAQVVYPKDQAMIVTSADVCPGATVVEAGAGSGALTCALLRAVGPTGRVISFELREEHAEIAERNVTERFGGHPVTWELRRGDVTAGLAAGACDRLVLDLLEPWEVLKAGAEALRPGGIVCAYTPTVPQVMRLREALDADGRWGLAQTFETIVRAWHVEGLAVRPEHRMVAHTAFLTTARRLAGGDPEG